MRWVGDVFAVGDGVPGALAALRLQQRVLLQQLPLVKVLVVLLHGLDDLLHLLAELDQLGGHAGLQREVQVGARPQFVRVDPHASAGRASGRSGASVQTAHLLRVRVQADRDGVEVLARPLGVARIGQEVNFGAQRDPVVVVLKVVAGVRFLGTHEFPRVVNTCNSTEMLTLYLYMFFLFMHDSVELTRIHKRHTVARGDSWAKRPLRTQNTVSREKAEKEE